MLCMDTLTLGAYQVNTYVLWDSQGKDCVVIDPGYAPQTILSHLAAKGLSLTAILLTHGHFDHVGAVKALVAETDCRVYLCPEELSLPEPLTAGPLFYTHTYGEGDSICVAGLTFRVLHTPGHTPGSVCLLTEDALFSGDTLFAGSCGRTDFPGGSFPQMQKSLIRLAQMKLRCRVYPGHGEATSLQEEIQYNPYLQ